jgi:hypothetical protein
MLWNSCKTIVWSAEYFTILNFVKIWIPKSKWCTKSKVKLWDPLKPKRACYVLSLSDEKKIWDLLKGSLSSVEVGWHGGKNELSNCRTTLEFYCQCCLGSVHLLWLSLSFFWLLPVLSVWGFSNLDMVHQVCDYVCGMVCVCVCVCVCV